MTKIDDSELEAWMEVTRTVRSYYQYFEEADGALFMFFWYCDLKYKWEGL